MTQSERQNTLLVTLLAGVAGAGIGMLFAPRSGKESRQRMREAAVEAKHDVAEGLESAKEQLDEKMDKIHAAKNKLLGNIRKKKSDMTEDDKSLESPIIRAWDEEV